MRSKSSNRKHETLLEFQDERVASWAQRNVKAKTILNHAESSAYRKNIIDGCYVNKRGIRSSEGKWGGGRREASVLGGLFHSSRIGRPCLTPPMPQPEPLSEAFSHKLLASAHTVDFSKTSQRSTTALKQPPASVCPVPLATQLPAVVVRHWQLATANHCVPATHWPRAGHRQWLTWGCTRASP